MTDDMQSRADFILEFMQLGMDFNTACAFYMAQEQVFCAS